MGRHASKRGVLVYMPEPLHRWLKSKAALEGRSLSAVIEDAARGAYPDAPRGEDAPQVAERPANDLSRHAGRQVRGTTTA